MPAAQTVRTIYALPRNAQRLHYPDLYRGARAAEGKDSTPMLTKPDIQDELLINHLVDVYGVCVDQLVFLPLGADVHTAVYQVDADDDGTYFLKLRRGPLDEMSVILPAFLSDQGITEIIAPLRTTNGQLWSRLDSFTVILYPFVEGRDAYEVELSPHQWIEFGAALRRIHAARLPASLRCSLPHETYSPYWREQVRGFRKRMLNGDWGDPLAAELAMFLQAKATRIDELVEGAERLGQVLQERSREWVLCHADIHAGNLLLSQDGSLYIVDWDTSILAPKERDLMFVGSGLGPGWNHPHTTAWFYRGYGPAEVDLLALAYYRCERLVQDIAAFCEQILSTTEADQDRRQSLRYLVSNFEPDGVAEIAQQSCRLAEDAGRR